MEVGGNVISNLHGYSISDVFEFSNMSVYTTVVHTRKTSLKRFVSYYGTMGVLKRNVKFLLTCTVAPRVLVARCRGERRVAHSAEVSGAARATCCSSSLHF